MAPSVDIVDLSNTTNAYHSPATIVHGNARVIHISGQVGTTKKGYTPPDYESQIHLALLNLRRILVTTGATTKDIAKLTLYIVNYDPTRRKHTRHLQRFLRGHRPAITLVPVSQLASPAWLFEVDAVISCPDLPQPQAIPRTPSTDHRGASYDVVIIGAGLAGLSAAHDVLRAGFSCVVLESRDRVGGKLWSQPMEGGNGVIELGAGWLNDVNQTKMINLVRRFGLETLEQNTTGNCVHQDTDGSVSSFPYGELPKVTIYQSSIYVKSRMITYADVRLHF